MDFIINRKAPALFLALITLFALPTFCFAESNDNSSDEIVKKPEKCYELVTGENEEYYSKLTINSRSVLVEGCYKNDPVTNISFQNCGTVSSTLKVNPDGTFTSVLNPSEPIGSSDRIVIKLKSIAKWVSDNIYYDRDARENSVTQSEICIKNVLKSRKTVCVGYSALFSALCEAQGIYVVNVKGTVTSDTVKYDDLADGPVNHEWCAALIDDRWIWVDCVWNSNLKYENNKFKSMGANTQMYFDISPLALSFDHCAYLAEKRYYFRAGEYFSRSDETTTDSRNESTPSADTSVSAETSTAATKPQTYTAPENYSPVTSDVHAQKDSPDNANSLILITVLSLFVIAGIVINVINISQIRKNKK